MFTNDTKAAFYNTNPKIIQRMLDYEYLCSRPTPSIICTIHPTDSKKFILAYYGDKPYIIPQYNSIEDAYQEHKECDLMLNFASFRSAGKITSEASKYYKIIHIVAEGIEERLTRDLRPMNDGMIIGPSSVGAITPSKFKVGNIGGSIENIISSKLLTQGSVGLVTRSGGLFNELAMLIARNSNGIAQGVAIGGEKYAKSTFLEVLEKYESDPSVKFSVIIGEVGGDLEIEVADAYINGHLTKPIIGWCIGTCADKMDDNIQFGHGGSFANNQAQTAVYKNQYMKEHGILVPDSFDGLEELIIDLTQQFKIDTSPVVIEGLDARMKTISSRKKHNFICTISDDRGGEASYNKTPISEYIDKKDPIISTLTNLWFKKDFPAWANDFLTSVIVTLADHGPAVSGAHNARVTARAGKDVVDSLVTGLLTIGPRFGGAIDGAGRNFYIAVRDNQSPQEFVDMMKKNKTNIAGIGHLVKSIHNPDVRVEKLIAQSRSTFPKLKYLDFALSIQSITIQKKENLILNVDGVIAALILDMLESLEYSSTEIDQILTTGTFNSFFIWARSLGFIGHILDEKRLDQGLYRHDVSDILYL
jgi:ATP-citrate lyase alpha-subunit